MASYVVPIRAAVQRGAPCVLWGLRMKVQDHVDLRYPQRRRVCRRTFRTVATGLHNLDSLRLSLHLAVAPLRGTGRFQSAASSTVNQHNYYSHTSSSVVKTATETEVQTAPDIQLRDYQEEAVTKVLEDWKVLNKRHQLLVLPTGCGKTVVFSAIAKHFLDQGQKVLVIAHRQELLQQAREKLKRVCGDVEIQEERAEHWASEQARVVLASVQTLARAGTSRMHRFSPEEFGLLLIDEAHHAPAETYQRIVQHFTQRHPNLLVLGVTATKDRTDKKAMDSVFTDGIVYERSMLDMQRVGWLAPTITYQIRSNTDLTQVPTLGGDYNLKQLNQAVNTRERNGLIVDSYLQKFDTKQALVFCCGLEHVQELVGLFNKAGVSAGAITGAMSSDDRHAVLDAFTSGKMQVVCNYAVLTEGFDFPGLGLIIQARPTQSALLLTQMVGRANRIHPGKQAAEVVEIMDTKNHRSATVPQLFGFLQEFDCEGHHFLDCVDKANRLIQEKLEATADGVVEDDEDEEPWSPFKCRSWSSMVLELPKKPAKPQQLTSSGTTSPAKNSEDRKLPGFDGLIVADEDEVIYAFTEVEHPNFELVLILEVPPTVGLFVVQEKGSDCFYLRKANSKNRAVIESQGFSCAEDAMKLGCLWLKTNRPDLNGLLNLDASWRKQPCSEKQFALLEKLHLLSSSVQREQLTKGEAGELLNEHFVRRSFEKFLWLFNM